MHCFLCRCAFAALILVLSVRASVAQPFQSAPGPVIGEVFPLASPCCAGHAFLDDRNGPVMIGHPLLEPYPLGWFATAEVALVASHVQNQLTAPVLVGVVTDQVRLPSARLNWTAAPRVEVGYRCGQGAGELLLTYRSVATSGSETLPGFDNLGNAALLRSRLDMNIIDVDYASKEKSLHPWLDMKWRVGVRLANLYFDSEATSLARHQHVTNHFFGAGPHATLDLSCPVLEHHVGLFCRIDAAGVGGRVQQGFAETLPGPVSGVTRLSQCTLSSMLNVQAGIAWTPWDCWRVSLGYTYEHWWDATFAGSSRGEVWTQGLFARGEWKF